MRSLAVVALLVAALAWLVHVSVQRIVLAWLVVMTLALSGCYWIVPDQYDDPPVHDLLCRPWWREVCQVNSGRGTL